MKQAFEYFIDAIILVLIVVVVIGIINISSQISQAQDFHNVAVAEVEASNFNSNIINKYETGKVNSDFKIEFKNVSTKDTNNDYIEENIYKVTTKYTVSIPILGYKKTNYIVGYAR